MADLVIYGAGGFAREVAWLSESCSSGGSPWSVRALISDGGGDAAALVNGIPVLDLPEAARSYPGAGLIAAVGSPRVRSQMIERATTFGFSFPVLIHPSVLVSRWVEVAEGAVICAGAILTTNIVIGAHVQINLGCTIGHDVELEQYATLAPGVHVSGRVRIGPRAYVGTGAVIINGSEGSPLQIGADAVIGAGACVTRSIPAGVTAVGVPARPISSCPQ